MSETVNSIKKGVEFSAEDEYRVIYDRNAFPLIFTTKITENILTFAIFSP